MTTAVALACVQGLDAKTVAEDSKLWSGCSGEPYCTVVTGSPMLRVVTGSPMLREYTAPPGWSWNVGSSPS